MKRKQSFTDLARLNSGYGLPCFDDLDPPDQAELAGRYILENYDAPNELEPIVEALAPREVNAKSAHAQKLYELMCEGVWDKEKAAQWTEGLIDLICKELSGCVQEGMEKANEPPPWADDEDAAIRRMPGRMMR